MNFQGITRKTQGHRTFWYVGCQQAVSVSLPEDTPGGSFQQTQNGFCISALESPRSEVRRSLGMQGAGQAFVLRGQFRQEIRNYL